MKKMTLLLFLVLTITAYSQKTSISTVNTVKPKLGQKMAFEAAYKAHIARFHKSDEKMSVYEIMSGEHTGAYHLVNGNRSYEDFDKQRADASTHSMDLDKNFFPYLESTMNSNYRYMDSLSLRSDLPAEAFVVNVRQIKPSMVSDYRMHLARGVKVLKTLKGGLWDNYSLGVYEKMWAGSDPVFVTVRNLKDGFKSLESDYYGTGMGNMFRDEYVKQFGSLEWDKRQKFLEEAVTNNEQYIMKLRKDLSSN